MKKENKIKVKLINICPNCGSNKYTSDWAAIIFAKCKKCSHIWQFIERIENKEVKK